MSDVRRVETRRADQYSVTRLAKSYGRDAIDKLAYLMENAEDERVQMAAAEKLLERGYGKPTQATVQYYKRIDEMSYDEIVAMLGGNPETGELPEEEEKEIQKLIPNQNEPEQGEENSDA